MKPHSGFRSVEKSLSAREREALPVSKFGLPAQRKYPVPDASHAQNALARASQQYNAGNLSATQKAKIDSKAHSVLKKSGRS